MILLEADNPSFTRVDGQLLLRRISSGLNKNKKFQIVTFPNQKIFKDVTSLRQSKEYDKSTVSSGGQMKAPNVALSLKITQEAYTDRKKQGVECNFSFAILDLETDVILWENIQTIRKELK